MIGSRKWLYILPNLFTLTSIFCGFYAMSMASGDASPEKLYAAALAILFGMLCDGLDGRVARLTRTQSDFGMQLDSLADVITFGVAPALLVWKWALAPMGFIGLFLSFAFAACGALRLARFNVLEMRGSKGSSAFFVGLPIPLAAGVIVSLVIAHYRTYGGGEAPAAGPVALLVMLLAYLMVSTVRYRTFKRMQLSRKSLAMLAFCLTSGIALSLQFRASFALVAFGTIYVFGGLLEEVIFFRRRREERLATRAAASVHGNTVVVDTDDDEEED